MTASDKASSRNQPVPLRLGDEPMMPILLSYEAEKRFTEVRHTGQCLMVTQVPFSLLSEDQAQRNHSQSLKRLAERGGLGHCEMVAVMERRPWRRMPNAEANRILVDALLLHAADGSSEAC